MRIKLLMLAVAASLAATAPARAALSLQFFSGLQNLTPSVQGAPNPTNPTTLLGLKNWQTNTSTTAFPGGGISMTVGQQLVVKIVLVDTFTGYGTGTPTAAYPTGSGYIIPDDNSVGLFQFATKLTFNPAVTTVQHDPVNNDGVSNSYTVNGGGNFGTATGSAFPAANGTGTTNENIGFANSAFGANFVTLGNIMSAGSFNSQANDDGTGNLVVGSTAPVYRLVLASFVLTATGAGAGTEVLSIPNTPPPSFSSTNSDDWSSLVWGPGGTTTYSIPVTVTPEPSSMVLAGLVVSGIGYRLRRKKVAEVTV